MRAKRRNIQLELALEPEAKGEAPSAGKPKGPKSARRVPTLNARRGPSMEAVVEPGNLKKVLARVRRNKGAPGFDGMRRPSREGRAAFSGIPSASSVCTR